MNAFIPASFLRQENAFKKTPVKVAWVGENMTIPEVVTDVMNCQLSQEELSQRLGAIAAWAQTLVSSAAASRKSLAEIDRELKPVADVNQAEVDSLANLYLGPIEHPAGVNPAIVAQGKKAVETITASAYVHQTYALPLHKVLTEFRHLADQCMGQETFASALNKAADPGPVNKALTALDLPEERATTQLGGFFALLRYYAIALSDKNLAGGLGKNHPALLLFYKTSLANIRAKFAKDYPSLTSQVDLALRDINKRSAALTALATDVGDPAWKGYLNGLVDGTGGDHVIDKFKNEYSGELFPGDDALGVVVENRRLAEIAPPADGKRYAPPEWPGLAEALRQRLSGYWSAQ